MQTDPTLTSPMQSKEKMIDPMNQLVIYQKKELEWEDLEELEEIEEGEILEERSHILALENIQVVQLQCQEPPIYQEIISFENVLESK